MMKIPALYLEMLPFVAKDMTEKRLAQVVIPNKIDGLQCTISTEFKIDEIMGEVGTLFHLEIKSLVGDIRVDFVVTPPKNNAAGKRFHNVALRIYYQDSTGTRN